MKGSPPNARAPTRPPVLVLLLGALLLVTLINTARELEYFRLRDDAPVPTRDVVAAETNCTRLVASHVDPNFFHEDACLMRTEILSIIKELVFTIADAFDAHNVTYFLEAGTLLGAFRNHGVIVHDVDADVGIDTAGLEYIQHNPIEFPSEYAFTVWNSSLYPTSDRDDKLPARLIHKASGLYVDVFAFLDWKDPKTGAAKVGPLPSWCFHNCARCPTVKGGKELLVDPTWLFPVVNCTFEGRTTLKCPRESELYLRYTFGSNFMTPIAYNYNTASKQSAWTIWPLVLLLLVGL